MPYVRSSSTPGRSEPTGMFKLWNRAWEERVPFTMYVAGLLVRGPGLREHLDDAALPALIEHLRDGIRLQDERGQVDPLVAKPSSTCLSDLVGSGSVRRATGISTPCLGSSDNDRSDWLSTHRCCETRQ